MELPHSRGKTRTEILVPAKLTSLGKSDESPCFHPIRRSRKPGGSRGFRLPLRIPRASKAAEAFLRVGGFLPGGYDDDYSLAQRLSTLAIAAPGAVVYHTNPSRLGEIYRHARWIGASDAVPQTRAEFWRYCPLNPRGKDWRALTRLGEHALPLFRFVYGAGICAGMLRARRGRKAR